MKVMVFVRATKNSEAGLMPAQQLMNDMMAFNQRLIDAGILVDGDGLKPSSAGKRIEFVGDQRTVIDGPFAETKELVAGWWIWNVTSMDEAVAWAKQCPSPMPGETGCLELRPHYEAADFEAAGMTIPS
jgi:hypothetical protein